MERTLSGNLERVCFAGWMQIDFVVLSCGRVNCRRSSLVLLGLAAQDESNATPPQSLPEGSAVEMQVKH